MKNFVITVSLLLQTLIGITLGRVSTTSPSFLRIQQCREGCLQKVTPEFNNSLNSAQSDASKLPFLPFDLTHSWNSEQCNFKRIKFLHEWRTLFTNEFGLEKKWVGSGAACSSVLIQFLRIVISKLIGSSVRWCFMFGVRSAFDGTEIRWIRVFFVRSFELPTLPMAWINRRANKIGSTHFFSLCVSEEKCFLLSSWTGVRTPFQPFSFVQNVFDTERGDRAAQISVSSHSLWHFSHLLGGYCSSLVPIEIYFFIGLALTEKRFNFSISNLLLLVFSQLAPLVFCAGCLVAIP